MIHYYYLQLIIKAIDNNKLYIILLSLINKNIIPPKLIHIFIDIHKIFNIIFGQKKIFLNIFSIFIFFFFQSLNGLFKFSRGKISFENLSIFLLFHNIKSRIFRNFWILFQIFQSFLIFFVLIFIAFFIIIDLCQRTFFRTKRI